MGHEGISKAPEKVFFVLRPCRMKSTVLRSREEYPKAPDGREPCGLREEAEAIGAQRKVKGTGRGVV